MNTKKLKEEIVKNETSIKEENEITPFSDETGIEEHVAKSYEEYKKIHNEN